MYMVCRMRWFNACLSHCLVMRVTNKEALCHRNICHLSAAQNTTWRVYIHLECLLSPRQTTGRTIVGTNGFHLQLLVPVHRPGFPGPERGRPADMPSSPHQYLSTADDISNMVPTFDHATADMDMCPDSSSFQHRDAEMFMDVSLSSPTTRRHSDPAAYRKDSLMDHDQLEYINTRQHAVVFGQFTPNGKDRLDGDMSPQGMRECRDGGCGQRRVKRKRHTSSSAERLLWVKVSTGLC